MKTTFRTLVSLALYGVCASGLFGQQMQSNYYAAPQQPVGQYVSYNANVSAYGTQANQAMSSQFSTGGGCTSGCCSTPSCCTSACSECACSSCDHCCASKCCYGTCLHRTGGYVDWLYLSPRNVDMSYGVPQDGIGGVGTVPVGDVGIADLDYQSGVRIGFNLAIDCCSSIGLSYTWLDVDDDDFIATNAPNVIQPLTMYPGTFNAGFTSQQAAALYDLEYQLVDADYRAVLWSCKGSHVNYVMGARYAHYETGFSALYPFAPPDGTSLVTSEITFDGGGIRVGLEGERRIMRRSGLSVYSKGYISALAGQFNCDYAQFNQFNGTEALVGWKDDRVITISELEVGVNWTNHRGNVKVGAGYYFAIWDNMITTPEWVNSVQQLNFVDVGNDDNDTVAFDGIVVHAEFLF